VKITPVQKATKQPEAKKTKSPQKERKKKEVEEKAKLQAEIQEKKTAAGRRKSQDLATKAHTEAKQAMKHASETVSEGVQPNLGTKASPRRASKPCLEARRGNAGAPGAGTKGTKGGKPAGQGLRPADQVRLAYELAPKAPKERVREGGGGCVERLGLGLTVRQWVGGASGAAACILCCSAEGLSHAPFAVAGGGGAARGAGSTRDSPCAVPSSP